jgi:hypothetical protein
MNPEQQYNDRFQKKLEEKDFPVDQLSRKWKLNAAFALRFTSVLGMGVNPEDFKKLANIQSTDKLSLYHFACLSNNLQRTTPEQLGGMDLDEYVELMEESDRYVKIWQELTTPLRDELDKEFSEEMQQKVAASLKNGQKPMTAVKADA